MPLFFFHLRTPNGLKRDDIGVTHPDIANAYLEACKGIPGIAADLLDEGRDPMICAFLVTDVDDRELMVVPFDERLKRRRRWSAPVSSAVTNMDRMIQLCAEVKEQRAALKANPAQMRSLLT